MINTLWVIFRTKHDVHYYISAIMHRSVDDQYLLNHFHNEVWCALFHFSHYASFWRWLIPFQSFSKQSMVCIITFQPLCIVLEMINTLWVIFRTKHDVHYYISAILHCCWDYQYPLSHFKERNMICMSYVDAIMHPSVGDWSGMSLSERGMLWLEPCQPWSIVL